MNSLIELSFFLPELVIIAAWAFTVYQLFLSVGTWNWRRGMMYIYAFACAGSIILMGYQ
jgi:hypothetical protein